MDDIIDSKSDKDILKSMLAELAKSKAELQCARNDLEKVNSRISFNIVLVNRLIQRKEIEG